MLKHRQADKKPLYITTADGIKFLDVATRWRQITDVPEYRFDDIREGDIVIDIGANVGAFSIRAARLSRQVVAVEPLTCDILQENLTLNDAEVRVICGALGDGTFTEVCWDDQAMAVPTFPLHEIIGMAGGCDFLKCDCEGAEWRIDPGDLAGIRRIEMELHLPPICGQPDPALLDFISLHYEFTIDRVPCHGPLGLMGYLHAQRTNNKRGDIFPIGADHDRTNKNS
jgi:FkbM family methyltransferase